jgi:uncharacterized protein (TIGR02145 family)/uncharacterized repeat protein (TIGR02543 family)
MKNLILRMAVILTAAATLFYSGCNDSSDSDVTSGGHVDDLIDKTHGTNEPKEQESYTLKATASPTVGGSVSKSPAKDKYLKGESVMLTATAKAGYRFTGWTGDTASTNTGITIKMDGKKELVANFLQEDVVSYTLTINTSPTAGGTVSKSPDKLEYAAGEMVYVTAASKPGYAFTIWSGALSSRDSAFTITMDSKKELTANFAPRTYTLTVNEENGGTVSRNPGKSAYEYNEKVTITAYPDNGYKFKEWSGAATGTKNPVTVTIDGDKTLSASFEWIGTTPPPNEPETKYTLTAYQSPTNGGEVSRNPDKNAYTSGERVTVTAYPANGYKFTGWSDASTSTNTSITVTMNGNKSLTANFELITYTVSFNVNGGSGTIPSQSAQAGNSIDLPSGNNLSKTGSTFDGWSTNSSGTGRNYGGGSSFFVTGDVTLYAVWVDVYVPTYTITFNANGGTVSPTSAKTGDDGKLASLPTPTRSGYTFDGWYTASTDGTEVSESRVYSASATIYARWTEEVIVQPTTYTLTIAASDGGTVSPSVGAHTYDEGTSVTVTASANTGYTFKNWSGESTSTSSTINITMNGNKTLTANFQQNDTPPSGNTFVDSRDGKTYRKIAIGTQTWMAENLNYDVPGVATDVCYGNSADSCAKYGRLYNWSTAMTACPVGWHLPPDSEWKTLTDYVGSNAGTKLKSTSGWFNNGNGTDDYGFSALPGGHEIGGYGRFEGASGDGNWWSATRSNLNSDYASYRQMSFKYEYVYRNTYHYHDRISVRCVEDD